MDKEQLIREIMNIEDRLYKKYGKEFMLSPERKYPRHMLEKNTIETLQATLTSAQNYYNLMQIKIPRPEPEETENDIENGMYKC